MERLQDKEAIIQAHSIIALSKLLGSEGPNEVNQDEEMTILQVVLDSLCYDPAP